MWITITGFVVSLATILLLARKNLALGLTSGALILGLITLPLSDAISLTVETVTDLSVLSLALAMGLIPVMGGVMKHGGQIEKIVNNVRLPQRYVLPFAASLMGLLPMPGGALLSAPIVERAGEGVDNILKALINNWYRHLFILIYPLSPALIVASEICGLDLYVNAMYLIPWFLAASVLGYVFFLRHINGHLQYHGKFSFKELSLPLLVILSAPVVDFSLKKIVGLGTESTLIGVSTALILASLLSDSKVNFRQIIVGARPWNFAMIIIGTFLYLVMFKQSDAGTLIASVPLPPTFLAIASGFVLSLLTGRVQLPASIVFPVYLATTGSVSPMMFALIYSASYFGYITSPVHPCLVVTCEYFKVSIKEMISRLAWSTIIIISGVVVLACIMKWQ